MELIILIILIMLIMIIVMSLVLANALDQIGKKVDKLIEWTERKV